MIDNINGDSFGQLNLQNKKPAGGIIPLSEGAFTIDQTKLFVPFDEEKDVLNQRPIGSLLVEIQPFVIITSKDILLLDTGLGFLSGNELQIHKNLRAKNIEPSQITKVLLTHLHKDHAGGVSFGNEYKRLSFSNATYYIQKRENEYALEKGFPSFIPEELEALQLSKQIQWLDDDKGIIDDYIFYELTAAHSPYHQVFWIKAGEQIIFFGGDDAPQLHQMKVRYKTKYDFDPQKAMLLRQAWWEEGRSAGWTFLFYHDIKTPFYKA
jgi:glyoxylase-like metal-dependent hydrolase (beta-lactamase superfamily II)